MPALVSIEPPTNSPAELVAATLRSCNAALGEQRCVLADAPIAGEAEYRARIIWDSRQRVLRVDFYRRSEDVVLQHRRLEFSARDDVRLRWASAGLVIAAYVASRGDEPTPPAATPVAAEPRMAPSPTPSRAPPPSIERRWPRVAMELGGLVGSALEGGDARLGAFIGVIVGVRRFPLFPTATLRYSAQSGEPTLRWVSGALGVGVRIGSFDSPLGAEVRSELVAESMTLMAEDRATGEADRATRLRFGSAFGVGLVWSPAPRWSLFAGAQASVMRPEVEIDVRGEHRGTMPAFNWSALAGARLWF
jgi:hypothetical protein